MRASRLSALFALVGAALAGDADAQSSNYPAALAKGYRIEARSAYEGTPRYGDSLPIRVTLENVGPDSIGALVVGLPGEPGGLRYPITLPRGAKKALSVQISPVSGAQIRLQTDRGAFEVPVSLAPRMARSSLLAIGDGSGGLAFLEVLEKTKAGAMAGATGGPGADSRLPVAVSYARPESAPESEAGFDRLSCVALMSGSERLNERQLSALRRYVLRGGHLVLVGGASAPILTDSRIRDLVPYAALEPREISVAGKEVSVQRPSSITSARDATTEGVPILRRDYGMGRVTYLAADPTEGGLSKSPLRKAVANRAFDLLRAGQSVRANLERGPNIVPTGTPAPSSPGEVDPFSLPIPATGSILLVLGAYFVVVLPINFLVLRAFRRLELAWFTAPLVAIGFAALLFRNAGSLYSTGLSYAGQATILAPSGGREGLALGAAQIFYPQATRGPIPIPGAEAVSDRMFVITNEDGYSSPRTGGRALDVVVTDAPAIPEYASTALEFRDVQYRQTIALGAGIRVIGPRRWKANGDREIVVENNSPFSLREVRVAHGPANDARILGTDTPIPAGGRAVLHEAKTLNVSAASGILNRDVPMLVATIDDAPVGPRLGKRITSRTSIRVLVSGEVR